MSRKPRSSPPAVSRLDAAIREARPVLTAALQEAARMERAGEPIAAQFAHLRRMLAGQTRPPTLSDDACRWLEATLRTLEATQSLRSRKALLDPFRMDAARGQVKEVWRQARKWFLTQSNEAWSREMIRRALGKRR